MVGVSSHVDSFTGLNTHKLGCLLLRVDVAVLGSRAGAAEQRHC